jgi:hypothetical protein
MPRARANRVSESACGYWLVGGNEPGAERKICTMRPERRAVLGLERLLGRPDRWRARQWRLAKLGHRVAGSGGQHRRSPSISSPRS